MIIGVTGTNCAGKSTIVEYLKKKGFAAYSLSDMLREEAKKRNLDLTVDNLVALGNELREKEGASTLALRAINKIISKEELEKIKEYKHTDSNLYSKEKSKLNKNIVIESIRNPAEVIELKKFQRKCFDLDVANIFFLIVVDAPLEIRFKRFNERKRVENEIFTFEEFKKIEERSLGLNQPETGQKLQDVLNLSEYNINSGLPLEELYMEIEKAIKVAKQYQKDIYYMNMAIWASSRSDCKTRMVGALLVKDDKPITTGFNGSPRGIINCNQGGCPRCNDPTVKSGEQLDRCICVHAEVNAILQALHHGISTYGATLYSLIFPCKNCTKEIIQAGIKRIVYVGDYATDSISLFEELNRKETKIELKQLKI